MSETDGESDGGEETAGPNAGGSSDEPNNEGQTLQPAEQCRQSWDVDEVIHQGREELGPDADANDRLSRGYKQVQRAKGESDEASSEVTVRQTHEDATSPRSSISIPDDTPSIQGSFLSSPGSSLPPFQAASSLAGTSPRLGSFDRRFQSRLSPSPFLSPRAASPAFLSSNSRTASLSSQILKSQQDEAETPPAPWQIVRWTKLKRISGQAFSEVSRRSFGKPTCLAVAAHIIIGTSKGIILAFDYRQSLKAIIGQGTKALECGSITSLAISADHSTIASGHANGSLFTWDLARPAKPFLQIPPMARSSLEDRKADGHVLDSAVLHVGFLGTRHTALVSANDAGMAFSHLATRGLGAVGRTVKTTRLLGRYPEPSQSNGRPRKPSSVLAFSPLPLGNVEQSTDSIGLTALLTPYLLVIVSTTPIAQTQHKASRPKEIVAHSALSGCLAWLPAVRIRKRDNESDQESTSRTKLVYCWSNILTVLEVQEVESTQPDDKNGSPKLQFRASSRWRSEEAIVAVQWLSRSVLGVLTITQRLIILEDYSLRVTDSSELIQKHIYHQDLFSRQLHPVVEQLNEEDESMHGVIADAFYMSFRAYKGRLFVLGFNEISMGTLSNWADRLLALMEDGDYLGAIRLATSFYKGDTETLTVGLPEDEVARQDLVREKLLEMISASLKYTFGGDRRDQERSTEKALEDLMSAALDACLSLDAVDFLFEDVYEWYERGSVENIFFETLEPYVLEGKLTAIPPDVLKSFITYYTIEGRQQRIEEVICRLSTLTFDIDQITTLCKQHLLYDALIYVWNDTLRDYVTPLIDLLSLIQIIANDEHATDHEHSRYLSSAMKVFPYLACILTGREYPSGALLDSEIAHKAKSDLYGFLLSGTKNRWPKVGGQLVYTKPNGEKEPPYPYLYMLLKFDAGSCLSMLNEAFEDTYFNDSETHLTNGQVGRKEDHPPENTVNRRKIVNILLSVMRPPGFGLEDIVYLDMFLARNLAKFPQFLELPGSVVHQVIVGLSRYPSPAVADDCQLSVEYLLSVYHPPDLQSLIPFFTEAHFYRVLKQVYKAQSLYAKLVETFLDDPENKGGVFDCIRDCLRPSAGLSRKQVHAVKTVIRTHAADLAKVDTIQTAHCLKNYAPDLLEPVYDALHEDPHMQFVLLRAILEPNFGASEGTGHRPEPSVTMFVEPYVRLMCQYDPVHVADYVGLLSAGDMRLQEVLPAMEKSGVINAAVVLLARDGLVRDAMARLTRHLSTLESAVTGLITVAAESPDPANTQEAVDDLLDAVHKYAKVGIWLCQGQTRTIKPNTLAQRSLSLADPSEKDLTADELLWLELIDALVMISQRVTRAASGSAAQKGINVAKIIDALRHAVQQTFTALLTCTSDRTKEQSTTLSSRNDMSFLRILRAFLSRGSHFSPSLSDLRAVLADIFAAYTYEENILSLANRFLDKDLFVHVAEANARRHRGWKPRSQVCDGCRRRVWGPGAGAGIWDAWEKKQSEERRRRASKRSQRAQDAARQLRGKGKATATGDGSDGEPSNEDDGARAGTPAEDLGPLVIFSCRHLYHRKCLERVQAERELGEVGCPLCR